MAYVDGTLPNFCYGADVADFGAQGSKHRVIDMSLDFLEQSPALVPHHHAVGLAAMNHTCQGPITIHAPCQDTALTKMLAKLGAPSGVPAEPQVVGPSLAPYATAPYDVLAFGSVPAPPGLCSWWSHEAWNLNSKASPASATNSGPATTNTCDSLPSLIEHDHHGASFSDEISGSPAKSAPKGMTTLMVRNVPVMYTQKLLLKEWSNCDGAYDFLYLPRSAVGQTNLSFAFINFTSEAKALAFKERWHKQRMARFTARKPLNIGFAHMQGLRANILQVAKKRPGCFEELSRNEPYILVNGMSMGSDEALAILRD